MISSPSKRIDPELAPTPGAEDHLVACLLEPETRRRLWHELQTGGPAARAARKAAEEARA